MAPTLTISQEEITTTNSADCSNHSIQWQLVFNSESQDAARGLKIERRSHNNRNSMLVLREIAI